MRTLLFSLLLAAVPAQATVNAYLDRYTITEGNSIRLTLESDQARGLSPDLSPLHKEFQILGSKKMSITSKVDDGRQTTARWQVLLRPKRPGTLKLPAIQVGPESSAEMEVVVERADRSRNYVTNSQATLELMADKTTVYKDGQLILTVRLTDNLALPPESTLKVPEISHATVVPFGSIAQRQTVRRGQVFNLMERRFLVFPQESGTLTIPAQTLILPDTTNDMRQVISEALTVQVQPAARQQNRGFWLPASNVTLSDDMGGAVTLTVGESFERTLTLSARGIRADQLPALTPLRNELATIDVIDVQRAETLDNQGMLSTRTETVRITPHERGEITLAAIDIPWWDTQQERSQNVSLPSRQITAQPAVTAIDESAAQNSTAQNASQETESSNLIYLIAGALLAAAGGAFWFIRRRKQAEASAVNQANPAEEDAFETLTMACHQPDPFLAQQALVLWAQEFWAGTGVQNLADVGQLAGSETFYLLIEDMQQHMDNDSHEWQGDLLLQAVTMLRSLDEAA